MPDRRTFLAILALAIAAPAVAAESPREIVVRIYKLSAGPKGDYSGSSAFFDKKFQTSVFSKPLLKDLLAMDAQSKKDDAVPGLDFDPVTASQDPSVKKLSIASESEDGGTAVAAATFFSYEETKPTIVRYYFVRENGAWKLDDMSSGEGESGWKLRELIKLR